MVKPPSAHHPKVARNFMAASLQPSSYLAGWQPRSPTSSENQTENPSKSPFMLEIAIFMGGIFFAIPSHGRTNGPSALDSSPFSTSCSFSTPPKERSKFDSSGSDGKSETHTHIYIYNICIYNMYIYKHR